MFPRINGNKNFIGAFLKIIALIFLHKLKFYSHKTSVRNSKEQFDRYFIFDDDSSYMFRDSLKPIFEIFSEKKKRNLINCQPIKKSQLKENINHQIFDDYKLSLKKQISYGALWILSVNCSNTRTKQILFFLNFFYVFNIKLNILLRERSGIEQLMKRSSFSFITGDVFNPSSRQLGVLSKHFCGNYFEVQFGDYNKQSVEWYYSNSDYILVWGVHFKKLFSTIFSIPAKKILVTGNPRFDYIHKINKIKSNKKESLSKKNVLVASTCEIETYNQIDNFLTTIVKLKKKVFKHFSDKSKYDLVIKLHPLENVKVFKKNYSNLLGESKIIQGSVDIRKLIPDAEIFITFIGSTATYDALIQKKRVVIMHSKNSLLFDIDNFKKFLNIDFFTEEDSHINVSYRTIKKDDKIEEFVGNLTNSKESSKIIFHEIKEIQEKNFGEI